MSHFRSFSFKKIVTILGVVLTLSTIATITVLAANASIATLASATISADTNGTNGTGAFTSLTGPVISEGTSGNIGTGSIIINAPTGFAFNTAQNVTGTISVCTGTTTQLNSGASQSVTPTASSVTFSVTRASTGTNNKCTLTFTNLQVRPISSTPTSGSITNTGSAVISYQSGSNSNWGTLTETAGALNSLVFSLTSPQTSGIAFTGTNTLTAKDQFNNTITGFSPASDNITITSVSPLTGTVTGLSTPGNKLTTAGSFVNGVANVSAMIYTGNATSGTFHAVSASGKTGDSGSVVINAGALSKFNVSVASPQTVNAPFAATFTAQDSGGNTITSFTGTVTLSSVNAGTVTDATTGTQTTSTFTNGVLTENISVTSPGTLRTVVATQTGGTVTGTSNTFTVNAGAASGFVISAISSPQTAGNPFNITITAKDASGNTDTSFNGTADLTTTASGITPSTTGSFTSGVRTQSVTLSGSGLAQTITATKTGDGAVVGTSGAFDLNPNGLDHFTIGAISSPQVAGTSFNISITAKDVTDVAYTAFTGTVDVSSSNCTLSSGSGTTGSFVNGALTRSVTFSGTGTCTIAVIKTGSTETGTSNSFTLSGNGTATKFVILQPANGTTDGSVAVTVQVQDASGNVVSTDSSSAVTVNTTGAATGGGVVSMTNGAGVINISDHTAQSVTLSLTDTTGSGLDVTSTKSFTFGPGTSTKLAFTTQPSASATANTDFGTKPVVSVEDQFGNVVTTDNSTSVAIGAVLAGQSCGGTPGTGVLTTTPSSPSTVSSGRVTYTATKYSVSENVALCATGGSLASALSNQINLGSAVSVTPATGGTTLSADTNVANGTGSTALTGPVLTESSVGAIPTGTIQLNTPTGFNFDTTSNVTATVTTNGSCTTAAVKLNSASSQTVTPSSTSATVTVTGISSGTGGQATACRSIITFSGIKIRPTAGSPLAATANITESGTSALGLSGSTNFGTLTEVAGNRASFSFDTISSQVIATPFNVTMHALDAYGNAATSFTGTTTLATTAGTITPAASGAFVAGVRTESVTLSTAGDQQITATRNTAPTATGTSALFSVASHGVASKFVIIQPTGGTTLDSIPVTIQLQDANGNLISDNSSAQVTLVTSGSATGGGLVTMTNGVGTANITDTVVETVALSLSDSQGTLYDVSSTKNLSFAPALDHFTVDSISTQSAGSAFQITAHAVDPSGNSVNYSGTVALTTTAGTITPTTSNSFINGVLTQTVTVTGAGSGKTITVAKTGDATKTGTSAGFTVTSGNVTKFVVLDPTDGTVDASIPVTVQVQDVNGNVVTSDNTSSVTLVTSGSATGGGVVSMTNGQGILNISDTVPQTVTLSLSDTSLTGFTVTSTQSVIFSRGAGTKLAITTQPPASVSAGVNFTGPTVAVQDQFGNTITGDSTSQVTLTAVNSDQSCGGTAASGILTTTPTNPVPVASGTIAFTSKFSAPTSIKLCATSGSLTSALTNAVTVQEAVTVTAATGGSTISADTNTSGTGIFTALTGPVIASNASGAINLGTIVLNAPTGFEFDTTGTAPSVAVSKVSGTGTLVNGFATCSGTCGTIAAVTTSSTISITITSTSTGGAMSRLTWQNVRVRPTGGSPLITANVTESGSASIGLAPSKNFGTLTEVAGNRASFGFDTVGTQVVNTPFNITMRALDTYGNPAPTFVGTTTLATTAGTIAPAASGAFVAGVRTESVTVTGAGASQTITATRNTAPTATGTSGAFTVNPFGAPAKFVILQPTGGTTSDSIPVTIQLQDANGNLVSDNSTAQVTLNTSGATAAGGGLVTMTNGVGVANVTDTAVETVALTLTDSATTGYNVSSTKNLTFAPALDHFAIDAISPQTAGSAFIIAIHAVDGTGTDVNYSGTVDLSTTAGTITPTVSGSFVNGVLNQTVTITGAGTGKTITVKKTGDATKAGTSAGFDVNAGTATKFAVLDPVDGTVDAAIPVTVQIQDQYGNVVTSDNSSSVTLVTSGSATGGGVMTMTGGSATLPISDTAPQTVTLSLSDTALTGFTVTSTQNVVFARGAGTKLAITTQPPTNATAGVSFAGPTVAVEDQFGNVVTSNSTAQVTLTAVFSGQTCGGTAGTGTLTSTPPSPATVASGTIAFSTKYSYPQAIQICATASSLTPALTNAVNVQEAVSVTAATGGGVVSADTNTTNGTVTWTALTGPVISGNVSGSIGVGDIVLNAPSGFVFDTTGTAPSVAVSKVSGNGTLVNGFATCNGTCGTIAANTTASTITITITSPSSGGAISRLTWQNVRVRPTAGTPLAVGNITQSGTASIGLLPNKNFGTLTEVAGARASFTFGSIPSPQVVNTPFNVTITAYDTYGSLATGFTGTTTLTTTAGTITPSASGAFVAGIRSESVSVTGAGDIQTITATRTTTTTATGTSGTFSTLPNGQATKYVIINPTDGLTISPVTVTVKLEDASGNVVTTGADKDKDVTLVTSGSATGGGLVDIVDGVGTIQISDVTPETVNLSLSDSATTSFDVSSVQDVIFSPSTEKDILSFNLTSPATTGVIDQGAQTVSLTVPFGTPITALAPTITVSAGASVSPVSGASVDWSSTNPQTYRVTAADGSTKDYAVTVTVALNTAKSITSFSLNGSSGTTISGTSISVVMPTGTTDLSNLIATFSTSGDSVTVGGTTQVSGTTANNFTAPVTYTVHASDGTTQDYTVTVTVALNTAKDLTAFGIVSPSATGSFSGNNKIAVSVPFGTNVTALVAQFTTTGTSVTVGATTQVSGTTANNFTSPVTYTVHAEDGSTKTYTVTVSITSTAKDIVSFNFTNPAVTGVVNSNNKTVALSVPFGTNVTALVPTITITGVSVSPASGVAQNFTNSVDYTVTAGDASTKVYKVTVTIAPDQTAKKITSFSFASPSATGVIDDVAHTVAVTVPFGTDVTALTPTISLSTGASVTPASGVVQNFTSPVQYTVTALDASTQVYTVTVSVALATTKDITAFSITSPSATGVISGTNIAVNVPFGTNVTALVPNITITGASVSPASGVAQDFTSPVAYTVTALDGSTKVYTVTVSQGQNSAKLITGFSFSSLSVNGSINNTTHTVTATVPFGTNVTALVPTITVSTNATINPASGVAQNFSSGVNYTVTAQDGTTQVYTVTVTVAPNSSKSITSFNFTNPPTTGTISGGNITLTVPNGTDVTALVPTIVHTGASVSPASGVAQDFSNTHGVTYTVTAADGTTNSYNVKVSVAATNSKDISGFTIVSPAATGVISGKAIAVTVPFGTNVTALVPSITITGATVSPASGVAQDFSAPVDFTVTAADASTKVYTVTVSVALNSAKDITGLSFVTPPATGVISGTDIAVSVPFGTDVTALTPDITISGASISPLTGVVQDFTNPVLYTVTAADASTKVYTVTVTVAAQVTHTLTYTAGSNGSITGTSPQTVVDGGSGTAVTAVPDSGFHFVNWSDGFSSATRTDSSVTSDLSVTANFTADSVTTHTITATTGSHGSISPSGAVSVNDGSNKTFTITPSSGYHVSSVSIDGSSAGTITTKTFTSVTANHTITVTFAQDSNGGGGGGGGSSSPSPTPTPEVSPSATPTPTPTPTVTAPGDLTGDGTVNVSDFISLMAQWGTTDGSGHSFGIGDFISLMANWTI